jgi:hypothetical protein
MPRLHLSIDDLLRAASACAESAATRGQAAVATTSPVQRLQLNDEAREFERLAEVFNSLADGAVGSGPQWDAD